MSAAPSRVAIVLAIVGKDLREFGRDRLWMLITPLVMVFMVGAFWLLPDRVDESIEVGLYPPSFATTMRLLQAAESDEHAIDIVPFDSEQRLARAVAGELEDADQEVLIGIAFPDDFLSAVRSGQATTVSVYVDQGVPPPVRQAVSSGIRELAYALQASLNGNNPVQALPITLPDEQTIVLGEDRAGAQISLRDKLRPLLALVLLFMEALALGGLVAVELETRTVTALLVTPARTADVLVAKGITGALLGVAQLMVFLLATRSFGERPLLVTTLVLLGAAMMSAVGMLAGAAGKDFMSTLFNGILFLIPLLIPAIAVIIPGSSAWWVEVLPSYGLIQSFSAVIGDGRGWAAVAMYLGTSAAWVVVLLAAGVAVLRRRVVSL